MNTFSVTQCCLKHSFISLLSFFQAVLSQNLLLWKCPQENLLREGFRFPLTKTRFLKISAQQWERWLSFQENFLKLTFTVDIRFRLGQISEVQVCFVHLYWVNSLIWNEKIYSWDWEHKRKMNLTVFFKSATLFCKASVQESEETCLDVVLCWSQRQQQIQIKSEALENTSFFFAAHQK